MKLTLRFEDGDYEMWAAPFPEYIYPLVFRVKKGLDARLRAYEKRIINAARDVELRPATVSEIAGWLRDHPNYPGKVADFEPF